MLFTMTCWKNTLKIKFNFLINFEILKNSLNTTVVYTPFTTISDKIFTPFRSILYYFSFRITHPNNLIVTSPFSILSDSWSWILNKVKLNNKLNIDKKPTPPFLRFSGFISIPTPQLSQEVFIHLIDFIFHLMHKGLIIQYKHILVSYCKWECFEIWFCFVLTTSI